MLEWGLPKERVKSEGRVRPGTPEDASTENGQRAGGGKRDGLEGGAGSAAPRMKCRKGHPLTGGD